DGSLLVAWDTYQDGLKRFPGSFGLQKAAGRLAVSLKRYDEAVALLGGAGERVTNDAELQHYLALAHAHRGDEGKARAEWEKAQHFRAFRPATPWTFATAATRRAPASTRSRARPRPRTTPRSPTTARTAGKSGAGPAHPTLPPPRRCPRATSFPAAPRRSPSSTPRSRPTLR